MKQTPLKFLDQSSPVGYQIKRKMGCGASMARAFLIKYPSGFRDGSHFFLLTNPPRSAKIPASMLQTEVQSSGINAFSGADYIILDTPEQEAE